MKKLKKEKFIRLPIIKEKRNDLGDEEIFLIYEKYKEELKEKIKKLNVLKNKENSCYIDSILYPILIIPNNYIYKEIEKSKKEEVKKIKLFLKYLKYEINNSEGKNITTKPLKKKLKQYNILKEILNNNNEQDLSEFLYLFLNLFGINPTKIKINTKEININIIEIGVNKNQKIEEEIKKNYNILESKCLIININRIINKEKTFEEIEFKRKIKINDKDLRLKIIIMHIGENCYRGHYISFFKYRNYWVYFNNLNKNLKIVDFNEIKKEVKNIKMLIYL